MGELENLLEFRDKCNAKGQTLSKPKYEKLTQLLLTKLEAKDLEDEKSIN